METIIAVVLGVVGGALVAGVAAAFIPRRGNVKAVTDVDELAVEVERIGRAVRRITMQRVRGTALDAPPGAENLPTAIAPGPLTSVSKSELRRKIFGGRT